MDLGGLTEPLGDDADEVAASSVGAARQEAARATFARENNLGVRGAPSLPGVPVHLRINDSFHLHQLRLMALLVTNLAALALKRGVEDRLIQHWQKAGDDHATDVLRGRLVAGYIALQHPERVSAVHVRALHTRMPGQRCSKEQILGDSFV